jgi:glycosidase
MMHGTMNVKENGYDISDFYDIDPSFGTPDDFDKLKARTKDLGKYDMPPPKPWFT